MLRARQHLSTFLPFVALLGAVALGVLLVAVARHPAPPAVLRLPLEESLSSEREIPSACGRTIVLERPAARIVALSLAAEEILLELVGPSRLAAATTLARDPWFSNVAALARQVPEIVNSTTLEQIIRLRPDLVLVASYTNPQSRELLGRAGIPVCLLPQFSSLESVRQAIAILGRASGLEPEAARLAERLDRRLRDARRRAEAAARRSGFEAPRLLFLDLPGGRLAGAWTTGAGTLLDELMRAAGCVNVAAEGGIAAEKEVAAEAIVRWDPGWLLIPGDPHEKAAVLANLARHPLLAATSALRAGRVIVAPVSTLTSTSHFCAGVVELLVETLHPPLEADER
jgi:iron complex transport system substrate-binding protein